jgi:hypothetical protein
MRIAAEWLDGPHGAIWQEIVRMHHRRQILDRYGEILEQAPDVVAQSGAEFHRWVQSNYAAAQLMAVRRQVDTRRDAISLARLLSLLHRDAGRTDAQFDRVRLLRETEAFAVHASDRIAHLGDPALQQPRHASAVVKFGELHAAIDRITSVFQSYSTDILGHGVDLSEIISEPWEYAFSFAWLPGEPRPTADRESRLWGERLRPGANV